MSSSLRDEIKALVEKPSSLCISIFLPTQHAGPPVRQNLIRFKNLLQRAESLMVQGGLSAEAAREVLKPARKLEDDEDFWRHQSDGFAIFLAPDVFRYYRLPLKVEELVVVTDRFHFKPLLPLLSGDGQFYVLALSQNGVRLLQGTRYSVKEVDLQTVPQSLDEALRYDEMGKPTQFRGSTGRGGGTSPSSQPGAFHGQGSPETDDVKQSISQYFHQVDHGVREFLQAQRSPLILAGVDYLLPIYQEANHYPHLVEEGLPGNPELLKPEELHDQAWQIAQPYFLKAQQEAADRYQELVGIGQASNNLQEIVPAALYGRIESLFVATGAHQWGILIPVRMTFRSIPMRNQVMKIYWILRLFTLF